MYQVMVNKKERMDISIISEEAVTIRTWGGNNFSKDHGDVTLSYKGMCSLIETLLQVKNDMENNKTDFF